MLEKKFSSARKQTKEKSAGVCQHSSRKGRKEDQNSPRDGTGVVVPGEGEAKNEKAIYLIFCA